MDAQGWKRVDDLLQSALTLPPQQRDAFLREACGGDEGLEREIRSLLSGQQKAADFLETPAIKLEARALAVEQHRDLDTALDRAGVAGQTILHYRITDRLGGGGMGVVYGAEDLKLGRCVALKFLPQELTDNPEARERFQREARAASALNHPNICTIYELEEHQGQPFIVMELLEGQTLRQLIGSAYDSVAESNQPRLPLPLDRVLDFGLQIADALDAAHQKGIIHRDIKPENIFITTQGRIKILDFGVATIQLMGNAPATAAPFRETRSGLVLGTVGYMSPEQWRGEGLDSRTDLFSFGVVLFEMATGTLPDPSPTMDSITNAVLNWNPAPAVSVNAAAPRELAAILSRALQKDRALRYQSAPEMRSDLQRLKTRTTSEALVSRELSTVAAKVIGSMRRRPLLFGGGLAVLLVLLLISYRGKWFVGTPQPVINSIAVLPFVNAGGASEYLGDEVADEIRYGLSEVPNLKVIAGSSVAQYRGKPAEPRNIGRELKVGAVVTGTFVKQDDEIAIEVELVNTKDSALLWGKRYEDKTAGVFDLRKQVVRELAERLGVHLSNIQEQRLSRYDTANREAYEAFIRGKYYRGKFTPDAMKEALRQFEIATHLDPGFAAAYAELGFAYWLLAQPMNALPALEGMPKARQAALKALQLDPRLALAHSVLGWVACFYDWDFSTAEQEFIRAIEINTNEPTAHLGYAFLLAALGRHEEAIREGTRAVEIDPLELSVRIGLSEQYQLARQFDNAIRECEEILAVAPDFRRVYEDISDDYQLLGDYDRAIEFRKKMMALNGVTSKEIERLDHRYHNGGIDAVRRADIAALAKGPASPDAFALAQIYAMLGDQDAAMRLLEDAYREHVGSMILINVDPKLDNLRSSPRFSDLLHRMGLLR